MIGIDQLLKSRTLRGEALGLITNPSGITSRGVPTWRALLDEGYSLKVLFGPEHGFRGEAQDAVAVGDATFRGLPVYSLFGDRLAPATEVVETLDTLLFDLQDVGCRFYTYLYTLALSMKVCEEVGTEIVVADRPGPILDMPVEGHPIDPAFESVVGGYGLPITPGLTVGELALYLQEAFFPRAPLRVIPVEGYRRSSRFQDLGLPWHLPSPNLPTLDTALVYPGTCLIEGTNLSEGRGTTRPFEIVGAPFIDGEELRHALAEQELPGVVLTSLVFTPTFSKWKGAACGGVLLNITDRRAFRPLETGITMLRTILALNPGKVRWLPDWNNSSELFFDKLAGGDTLRNLLYQGQPLETIMEAMNRGARDFQEQTRRFRLYEE